MSVCVSLVNINISSLFWVLVGICVYICIGFCVPHVSKLHVCRFIFVEPCVWWRCSLLLVSVSPVTSLSVPCTCLPLGAHDKVSMLGPRLLLCTSLVTLRESCHEGFANSWALLEQHPCRNICALGLSQCRIHLLWETPRTSPSGGPPLCPDPTLRTPYAELSISHVPQDHHVPRSPSLHRRFPLPRIRRVGWFLSISQVQITCRGRAMIGRGTAEFRGALGIRQPVWHSPLNSGFFLLNTVPLKWTLPAISPAKRGLHRINWEWWFGACNNGTPPSRDLHSKRRTLLQREKWTGRKRPGLFLDCVFSWKKRNLSPSCWALLSAAGCESSLLLVSWLYLTKVSILHTPILNPKPKWHDQGHVVGDGHGADKLQSQSISSSSSRGNKNRLLKR